MVSWRATVGEYFAMTAKAPAAMKTRAAAPARRHDNGWTIEHSSRPRCGPPRRPRAHVAGALSVQTPQPDGSASSAAWPALKPKDIKGSGAWGDLRFQK